MKKILLLLLITFSFKVFCQKKTSINDFKIDQEKIFIHLNSNFLLTGETLLYKISCLNRLNNLHSSLSKIVYVEILNDKKERVVLQKMKLKDGTAQSDFFIKNSLKSGNYKIIAYTKWMKNENLYSSSDINIINPFQSKIVKSNNKNTFKPQKYHPIITSSKEDNIVLNKKIYKKREKVSFKINLNEKNITSNNLSVSVRKIDNQFYFHKKNSVQYLQENNNSNNTSNNKIIYLPDARGDLIKGQIIPKSEDKPVENIKISLSVIQKNGFFMITNTEKNGFFYFILDNFRKNEKVYLQLIGADIKDYDIVLAKEKSLNFDDLNFKKLNTNKKLDSLIDKKSIYVQIENAYKNLKQDKITSEKASNTLPNYSFKKFLLDNYTRFKTLRETITELIPFVSSSKSKGNITFNINVANSSLYTSPPLLLIDGFIVNNPNEFSDIDMNLVEELSVSYNFFKFNSAIYKGIISIKTYKGNYIPKTKDLLSVNIKNYLANKDYFFPDYSKTNNKHIPDYRTQLFWEPNLNINKEISFYTSDINGSYEIEIEGFTNSGKPISLRKRFIVN